MIQMQTNLDIADNSGARRVQCIKVLGGSKRRTASVGDVIIVSVKEAIPRGRVKKGDVHRAVIVRTAKEIRRTDGSAIRFDRNAAVLVTHQGDAPQPFAPAAEAAVAAKPERGLLCTRRPPPRAFLAAASRPGVMIERCNLAASFLNSVK